MTRLGRASVFLALFAGGYAILMLINGQLTDFGVSAGVCAVALLGVALFAWRAGYGRAPAALPPVASTLEPQVSEEVLDSGVGDDRDRATGSGPDSDEWTPAETAIATIPVGGPVHDMIVSPDGEHVYVALSDSVMVVDARHHIVARIPVSGPAKSLVTDADGTQLFVVDYDGSVVLVGTGDYTAQTLWGGGASDVVVSPDGRHLYAAHNQVTGGGANGVVFVIDVACATSVATVPVNNVAALTISPDGSRLYAVSSDRRTYYQYPAGRLTIIDTASHAVVETIAVGACPETVTASPDGAYLYITHYDTCSVSAVNLTTGNVTAVTLRDAPLAVVFSPDSEHAYVCNVRSLTVIDTTTNDADDIDTGDLPRGVQLSPDGKRAYITNFGDRTLSVVDTITNSVATTVDVPGYPEAVAVSPDGERIYVGGYWSGAVAVISVPTLCDLHTDAAS
jgi:YVTN family beta-propeller protein